MARRSKAPRWNFVAMGEAGLTGGAAQVAQPVAGALARRTGRPESQILALIGAALLVMTLVSFLRTVTDVIAAGRTPSRD